MNEPPSDIPRILGAARDLRSASRWDEADALLSDAVQRWPDDRRVWTQYALLSNERCRWAEMAVRFQLLHERFPDQLFGYSRLGQALRWLGRFDEADRIISAGMPSFPMDPELLTQWVLVACDRCEAGSLDWSEAEMRGRVMLEHLPDDHTSFVYASEPFVRQRRFAEAELILADGLLRFGTHEVLARRLGRLAGLRGDWGLAAQRLRAALRFHPTSKAVHEELVDALLQANRRDDAEAVLGAACLRSPPASASAFGIRYAEAAQARGDWAMAFARWQSVARSEPNHPAALAGMAAANARLNASSRFSPTIPTAAELQDAQNDPARVLGWFESVGGSCEFGLVQRAAKREPLGLFRFAGISLRNLITALDTDFAGVGEDEFTRIDVRDEEEYTINDTRYGLSMHSFMLPSKTPLHTFTAHARRHLRFLVQKLRDDLRQPEKIVIRVGPKDATLEDVVRLHVALRRHGPVTLLFVQANPNSTEVGRARWLAPGILVGFVSQTSVLNIDVTSWHKLCYEALTLYTEAMAADAPSPRAAAA